MSLMSKESCQKMINNGAVCKSIPQQTIMLGDGVSSIQLCETMQILIKIEIEGRTTILNEECGVADTGEDVVLCVNACVSSGILLYVADPNMWKKQYDVPAPEEVEEDVLNIFPITTTDVPVTSSTSTSNAVIPENLEPLTSAEIFESQEDFPYPIGEAFQRRSDLLALLQRHAV